MPQPIPFLAKDHEVEWVGLGGSLRQVAIQFGRSSSEPNLRFQCTGMPGPVDTMGDAVSGDRMRSLRAAW